MAFTLSAHVTCRMHLDRDAKIGLPRNFSVPEVYHPAKINQFSFLLFACLFEMYYSVPQQCRQKWGYRPTSTDEQMALSSSFSACLLSVVFNLTAEELLKHCGFSVCYL